VELAVLLVYMEEAIHSLRGVVALWESLEELMQIIRLQVLMLLLECMVKPQDQMVIHSNSMRDVLE
jgi:hypothetical protein